MATLLQPSSPADSTNTGYDATQRHLALFLSDVAAQSPVPTLRSFLKLYTSLDAKKLANFLDADEEEMVQEMMVMKQASKSLSRVPGGEFAGLLDGQVITTSDLNFVIDEVSLVFVSYIYWLIPALNQNMVHITESTVGRRYAGWFIKNTERTQKIFDDLKHMPLPTPPASVLSNASGISGGANPGLAASAIAASVAAPAVVSKEVVDAQAQAQAQAQKAASAQKKVAWGGVRA